MHLSCARHAPQHASFVATAANPMSPPLSPAPSTQVHAAEGGGRGPGDGGGGGGVGGGAGCEDVSTSMTESCAAMLNETTPVLESRCRFHCN